MVALAAAALAWPAAAGAQTPCSCLLFARAFIGNHAAQRTFDREWRRTYAGHEAQRKVIRRRIYDWQKQGTFDQGWCKRHPKLCRALQACLIAGGYTFVTGEALGESSWRATVQAGGACATAATTIMVVG